mgnify:CR=1 FL=1
MVGRMIHFLNWIMKVQENCYDYVLKVAQKWVSAPYNVDGWRLDVAADLGHSNEFNHQSGKISVKRSRKRIRKHWSCRTLWKSGRMAAGRWVGFCHELWCVHGACDMVLTGMEKHSDEYREDLYGNSDAFIGAMKTHMRSLSILSSLHTRDEWIVKSWIIPDIPYQNQITVR